MPELAELEQRLASLGKAVDWPATPQLANRVRYRVAAPLQAWYQTRWAVAAAAVIVAAAALVAYTPTREAIATWVDLHVNIQRVEHLQTPSPLPSGPAGKRLGLGTLTTLDAAQRKVRWSIAVPSSLGPADEVYLQEAPVGPAQGEVTLVYAPRLDIPVSVETGVGVLITEARGTVDKGLFGKMLGPDTTLEEVMVGGHTGYWIAGKPHAFVFIDSNGAYRTETSRLATNTLIFDDNGTIVRIEANVTKDQALRIAASLG